MTQQATKKTTRRGHGEGTRYQRADGYWIGQITIGRDEKGRQQRKTISAKTEKDLIAKMKTYQYQQLQGELVTHDKVTLGTWIGTWLSTYKKNNLRPTTYNSYMKLYEKHIKTDYIGTLKVQKLTTHHIQTFMRAKAERLSPHTVNYLHFIIRSALEQAKKNNTVSNNVAANCTRHKEEKKEIRPLTIDEVRKLIEVVKPHELFPALILELHTGIRRGELLGLRWSNVNLEEGTITIVDNLVQIGSGYAIHKPKTKSSNRTIYLAEKALDCLKEHKAAQESEKTYKKEGFVFCTAEGEPIHPCYFHSKFKRFFKKAGLPKDTRFHDLRHTFVTNLINQGVDIKTAQSFTGHSDTSTLLDTYSHFVNEAQKQAAKKMNGVFLGV